MKPKEMFKQLEDTADAYAYFKKGRKYIYYSTGGWSDNEELINELEKELCFNLLLIKWETGGHYTFKIPNDEIMNMDIKRKHRRESK